jgi:hypothetical protein
MSSSVKTVDLDVLGRPLTSWSNWYSGQWCFTLLHWMNWQIQTKGHIHMEEEQKLVVTLYLPHAWWWPDRKWSSIHQVGARSLTSVLPQERWTNPRSKGNQEKTNSHLLYLWSWTIFCEFSPSFLWFKIQREPDKISMSSKDDGLIYSS